MCLRARAPAACRDPVESDLCQVDPMELHLLTALAPAGVTEVTQKASLNGYKKNSSSTSW